jgi:stage V sporulation protein R
MGDELSGGAATPAEHPLKRQAEMTPAQLRELEKAIEQIWDVARRLGLDPFPTHFEIVPASIMYEFGAYGLPGRFSHWTHGRAYHQMKTMYDYGLSKIYELVVNTNPCYAFLLEGNSLLQNKLVVAHVLAHCDFFKHNVYFQHTSRQMIEGVSVNAERIRRYEFEHGKLEVEKFLDAVLSIQEHVDPHVLLRKAAKEELQGARGRRPRRQGPSTPYDDLLLLGREEKPPEPQTRKKKIPPEPEKDVLGFIMEHAPDLEDWQRDIISIVRAERLYFVPQMQTKIMNEGWACATGDSLVLTEHGLIRFQALYDAQVAMRVASGEPRALHPITAFHKEEQVPTLRLRTRRGYSIEGALKHRVRLADGSWAFLSDVRVGQRIALAAGTDIWPQQYVAIDYASAQPDHSLADVAQAANVSVWTVLRHRAGRSTRSALAIEDALAAVGYRGGRYGRVLPTRHALRVPTHLDEELAYLLGYYVGDGNRTKSGICLTCSDEDHACRLAHIVERALGVLATVRADPTVRGCRWRVEVHAREAWQLLEQLGIDLKAKAPEKQVPEPILRSPRAVVSAFLRGYFDADAYAGPEGVILSSASRNLIKTVQVVLLNYGILSTQRAQRDGCLHLEIRGASARRFRKMIGFTLERKQHALDAYIAGHRWFKREALEDTIVSIEPGCADVYDITVDSAHAYVANGLVNHNSFWHARIMRELDLSSAEYAEFARMHAQVLAPSRRQLNPYYVGMKIFEDIERRWDNPSDEERRLYGRKGGEGRAKIFEVRELESDVSFLRTYLTKELVEELDLYIYKFEDGEWRIVEKDWQKVRDQLVANLTNFGDPYIVVENGDYRRNMELYLKHMHEGVDLDVRYAELTLRHVYQLWGRPVHLESVLDGKRVLFSYDGEKNTRTPL